MAVATQHRGDGHAAVEMKVAVIHTGARDSYQVAQAFFETGQLFRLFTSTYLCPRRIKLLSRMGIAKGQGRTGPIPQELVSSSYSVDILRYAGRLFDIEQAAAECSEQLLGRRAAGQSKEADVVISYNYMAQHVLPKVWSRKILFQCHPNPAALSLFGMSNEQLDDSGFAVEREFSWGTAYRAALEKEWQFADRIIAPSSFVKRSLVMAGAPTSDIVVVPYGCPPVVRSEPRKPPCGRLSLLFVGQFVWRKGADQLAVFARHIRGWADLTIVTRGFMDNGLMAEVKVEPNVRILIGASNAQLRSCYENSHALLFPSRYEGYGLVINEALSYGLPVISTQNTALSDILRTHRVGSLMTDISSDAMLASVSKLFDEGAYSDLSDRALDYARSNPWSVFRERVRDFVVE